MRIGESETQSMDIATNSSESVPESVIGDDPKFWESVQRLLRYGVPAYDKKGHWTEIRIRIRPMQVDLIGAVKEKMPDNWYKSMASFYRSLIAIGCKTALKYLEMDTGEWNEVLTGLNEIAKKERLQEFKEEVACLRNNIANGTISTEEKIKAIDLIGKLERRIMEM